MRKILRFLIVPMLAFAAGCTSQTPQEKEVAKLQAQREKDITELQGAWKPVKVEEAYKHSSSQEKLKQGTVRFVFSGNDLAITEGRQSELSTFTIDPGKTPRQMDMAHKTKKKKVLAIYRIEEDSLVICAGDRVRPTEFKAAKKPDAQVMFFERAKE